jgi:hypothetical protein
MDKWKKLEKILDCLPAALGVALGFDYFVTLKAGTVPKYESDVLINYFVERFGSTPGIILSGLCVSLIYSGVCYGLYKIGGPLLSKIGSRLNVEEQMKKYPILKKTLPYATMAILTTKHIAAALPRAIYL